MDKKYHWHLKPFLKLSNGYVARQVDKDLSMVNNNRKYGLIDFNGVFHVDTISDEPLIRKGLIPVRSANGKIGLLNSNNEEVFPFKGDRFHYVNPGYYALEIGNEVILLDEKGKEIVTEYKIRSLNDYEFNEQAISVEAWLDKGKTKTGGGYFDPSGKALTEFKYRYNYKFENGIAAVTGFDYLKKSFIDKKGNEVFQCPENWISIHSFDGELALIQVKDQKGFAFINKSFKIAVAPQFDSYQGYKGNVYLVSKEGQLGAIDASGKVAIPFEYNGIDYVSESKFIVNRIMFKKQYEDINKLWEYDNTYYRYGLYDLTVQKLQIALDYEEIRVASPRLLIAKRNDKYGYLTLSGEEYTPFEFEQANEIYQGRAWVKMDGEWGVIELNNP